MRLWRGAIHIRILWDAEVANAHPGVSLSIIASDVDEEMLARARKGCFELSSLYELPQSLVEQGFERTGGLYCIKAKNRQGIDFLAQDLRSEMPARLFDLILCRYVAFTYFALPLQRQVLARMIERLRPSGFLAIGAHEELPGGVPGLAPLAGQRRIFQKSAALQQLNLAS